MKNSLITKGESMSFLLDAPSLRTPSWSGHKCLYLLMKRGAKSSSHYLTRGWEFKLPKEFLNGT